MGWIELQTTNFPTKQIFSKSRHRDKTENQLNARKHED